MNKSKTAEAAWIKAASILERYIQNRVLEISEHDEEIYALRHIRDSIIPSCLQRARIIARNRRTY